MTTKHDDDYNHPIPYKEKMYGLPRPQSGDDAGAEEADKLWASIAMLRANRKELEAIVTRHTVNDFERVLLAALTAKPDLSSLIAEVLEGMRKKKAKALDNRDKKQHIASWNAALEAFAEKLTAALKDKGAL